MRAYRALERAATGFEVVVRHVSEEVVERGRLGPYCVERLQLVTAGQGTSHLLRVRHGSSSWRLGRLQAPIGSTPLNAIEEEVALLRATDAVFTLGNRWQLTYTRPHHGVVGAAPLSFSAQVESSASLADRDYAYVSYSNALYGGEVWIRRGARLWYARVSAEPDLSFTQKQQDLHWLPRPHAAPLLDVRTAPLELACSGGVCLPAWSARRDENLQVAFVPNLGPLRSVERDYSEETDDGGAAHVLLQSLPTSAGAATSLASGASVLGRESPALREAREALLLALSERGLEGLRSATSRNFKVSTFDEAAPGWTVVDEEWSAGRKTCALQRLREILARPFNELSGWALCLDPAPASLTTAGALAAQASVTLQSEGRTWRVVTYLDPLALASDEDANLEKCTLRP